MRSIRLIVNADDYGLTPGVSAGIRRAHHDGIVTCTTAMMVFDTVDADLQLAHAETPNLALGVHLTGTEYQPLRPAQTVRSLLNPNGLFRSPAQYYGAQAADYLAQIDIDELRDEWRAQIERFLALGLTIDHIDSHHHFAYIEGVPRTVLLELAREYRVPLRATEDQPLPADIRHPDAFVSAFYDDTATIDMLIASLEALQPGTTELMCHPGDADAALRAITSYHAPRATEAAVLCDQQARAVIERRRIELVPFAAL